MKKLTYILIATLAVTACTNDNREHRDTVSSSTTLPSLDTLNKAQTYTADVNLNGNEKAFLLNAALLTQRLTEFTHLANQRAKDLALRNQADKMEMEYRKMQNDLEAIANGKGILLSRNEEANELSILEKLQNKSFDEQYLKLILTDHAKLIQELNNGIKLPNRDIKNFAENSLQTANQNNIDIAKILK